MPKVSVLLTTYNRPPMLLKAIVSVLRQTYRDWELLILDDNSDNVDQLVLLLAFSKLDGVRVLRSSVRPDDRRKTTRYATMVNVGLDAARGEYIAYLCDDDYFEPQKLERAVAYLDTHPEAGVVYGAQRIVELKDGQEIPYAGQIREAKVIQESANCNVDHSSVVMRRRLYEELGGWDDDPGWWGSADGVYWEKLNKAGYYFYPIDEILDTHVYHDGSWTKEGRWLTEL